jgi:hypothetical protein
MSEKDWTNCEEEDRCENKDLYCDKCTRCWTYEEPEDWFMEKEEDSEADESTELSTEAKQ